MGIRQWLDSLVRIGPTYRYYVNQKTWLVVTPQYFQDAVSAFSDTEVVITSEGRPFLGSPLSSDPYITNFVQSKVENWISILSALTDIANSQPQAAKARLCMVSLVSGCTYVGPHRT